MTTVRAATHPGVSGTRVALAARAVVAAGLAVVATFDQGHLAHPAEAAPFGLLVLGVFEPAQALALLVGLRTVRRGRRARLLLVLRCALLALIGVLALVLPTTVRAGGTPLLLVVLEAAAFAVGGALELAGGLAPGGAATQRRDAVTMGGLQLVAAAMLIVLTPDSVFAVGVLGAWGAITAVYLGIAAASVGRPEAR